MLHETDLAYTHCRDRLIRNICILWFHRHHRWHRLQRVQHYNRRRSGIHRGFSHKNSCLNYRNLQPTRYYTHSLVYETVIIVFHLLPRSQCRLYIHTCDPPDRWVWDTDSSSSCHDSPDNIRMTNRSLPIRSRSSCCSFRCKFDQILHTPCPPGTGPRRHGCLCCRSLRRYNHCRSNIRKYESCHRRLVWGIDS